MGTSFNGLCACIVLGAAAGALADLGAAPRTAPRPMLRTSPFAIPGEEGRQGKEVTPQRPLELVGQVFADCDLHCQVELADDSELDLVFRHVDHWGEVELRRFPSRFHVLRMSSRGSGDGFLTRDRALFDEGQHGVPVSAGKPASVELSCRGRRARALVNGIEVSGIDTADDFGSFAFIARGGACRVKNLQIKPWPAARGLPRMALPAVAGAVLLLLLGVAGAAGSRIVIAAVLLAASGLPAGAAVFAHLLPAVAADPFAVFLGVAAGMVVAFALVVRTAFAARLILLLGAASAGLVLLDRAAAIELPRCEPPHDLAVDLTFGPDAGSAPIDALARTLRCTANRHVLLPQRYDVLLLGGKQMFDREAPLEHNIDLLLPGLLKRQLRLPPEQEVPCAAIPTQVATAHQQYLLLEAFYSDYRPRIVVLGVSGDEVDPPWGVPTRDLERLADERGGHKHVLALSALRASLRSSLPRRDPVPGDLAATLDLTLRLCRAFDSKLVLVPDKSLPEAFARALQSFAAANRIPLVLGFDIEADVYPIDALAEVLVAERIR